MKAVADALCVMELQAAANDLSVAAHMQAYRLSPACPGAPPNGSPRLHRSRNRLVCGLVVTVSRYMCCHSRCHGHPERSRFPDECSSSWIRPLADCR